LFVQFLNYFLYYFILYFLYFVDVAANTLFILLYKCHFLKFIHSLSELVYLEGASGADPKILARVPERSPRPPEVMGSGSEKPSRRRPGSLRSELPEVNDFWRFERKITHLGTYLAQTI